MEVNVIARTTEVDKVAKLDTIAKDFKLLAGKTAGICYMAEDYLDVAIQDEDKALGKAAITAKSGHHSVYEHAYLTVTISGIPKILAMLLNSTNCYVTSEKSARYTQMKPETEQELKLYKKWLLRFKHIITNTYPEIDEKTVGKLAQENARYMTSVFTPTTMAYTVSHRQLCYLICWLANLAKKIRDNEHQNDFNIRLAHGAKELSEQFKQVLGEAAIEDNKGREFEFIPCQYGHEMSFPKNYISDVYTYSYFGSFAQLAQAHRHRTLHYKMWFTGDSATEFGFYIPEIIRHTRYEEEWLKDIANVAYCYPQGTLVRITEQGLAEHFFLKCKERLCGRAQLEIALQTESTMKQFIENRGNLSRLNQELLDEVAPKGKVTSKCGMKGIACKEACRWGAKCWNTRKI